jgi:DNA processing protein
MRIEQEKIVRAALRSITDVGSQRLRQLIAYFGSAIDAWEAPQSSYLQIPNREKWIDNLLRERTNIEPEEIGDKLFREGIKVAIPGASDYPSLLAELADAPPLLYYRGHLQGDAEGLAVVGSRQATAYGKAAARMLARDAAARGIVIVSGLARGIDSAAHKGALESGGKTWAFLGCGVEHIYPKENWRLAEEIMEKGAVISEFAPGTAPKALHFPARNRLISGCSRGVLVVEAAERSGALITVDFALEQGREVFAVPGPIFSLMSKGTHHLLRQGAKIVEGTDDIWNEIAVWSNPVGRVAFGNNSFQEEKRMTPNEAEHKTEHEAILQQLSDVPLHIDQIILQSSLPVSALSLVLLELQLEGKITQLPGQHYVLAREC